MGAVYVGTVRNGDLGEGACNDWRGSVLPCEIISDHQVIVYLGEI